MKILKLLTSAIFSAILFFTVFTNAYAQDNAAIYEPQYNFAKLNTGINIAYVTLGDKKNTPVVLIHGVTDTYLSFSQAAPILEKSGFYVIVPELRGHGKSDKPKKGFYTTQQHAADINALLDKLEIKKAHIAGHSLGSFVAQSLAAANPDKVSSLILIGSTASLEGNETLAWLLEGDEKFPGINKLKSFSDDFLVDWTASSNYDPVFIKKTFENAKKLPLYAWVNAFNGIVVNRENLSKIKVPTAIIWGTQDTFFTIKDQLNLIENLGSDYIVFIKKEGASHNTHWENRLGEEVAGDIANFIKTAK
ncbi:MAG: alpha/beta hydrolase [Endomicrobium sp.]|jgi:pimeloyl-ACP methyl ester carboxylesterase|nr:alpha/beta hydrolase [Endomicrobium sp.]